MPRNFLPTFCDPHSGLLTKHSKLTLLTHSIQRLLLVTFRGLLRSRWLMFPERVNRHRRRNGELYALLFPASLPGFPSLYEVTLYLSSCPTLQDSVQK